MGVDAWAVRQTPAIRCLHPLQMGGVGTLSVNASQLQGTNAWLTTFMASEARLLACAAPRRAALQPAFSASCTASAGSGGSADGAHHRWMFRTGAEHLHGSGISAGQLATVGFRGTFAVHHCIFCGHRTITRRRPQVGAVFQYYIIALPPAVAAAQDSTVKIMYVINEAGMDCVLSGNAIDIYRRCGLPVFRTVVRGTAAKGGAALAPQNFP